MKNDFSRNLGLKLKELRLSLELTQTDVAGLLNMDRSSFSKYETGEAVPPVSVLTRLAKLYNIRIEKLLGDESPSILFRNGHNSDEPDMDKLNLAFTELSHEEKLFILKLRLLDKEGKEKLEKYIENDDNDNQ